MIYFLEKLIKLVMFRDLIIVSSDIIHVIFMLLQILSVHTGLLSLTKIVIQLLSTVSIAATSLQFFPRSKNQQNLFGSCK